MATITVCFAVMALVVHSAYCLQNSTWTQEQLDFLDKIRSQMDDLENKMAALEQKDSLDDDRYCLRKELETIKKKCDTVQENSKANTKRFLMGETQPVAFYAYRSTGITINSNQSIPYDVVNINVGNGYNGLSGQFKAPIAGIYHFTNTVMATPQHGIHVKIVKEGVEIGRNWADHNGYESGSVSVIVELEVGDLVWVKDADGGSEYLADHYNSFSGFLISGNY